jgi:signal transduction histidine kinase
MLLILALYCALLGLSLFNTVVCLWLGSMVLLNAENRRWSIWLAACGLLAGGAVFISHSAVLMQSASVIGSELNVWFPLGGAAIIFAPFAWYIAMLWHAGYWEDPGSRLHRRHRPAFLVTTALAAAVVVLFVIARPLPFTIKTMGFDISTTPAVFGIPLLVLLYPPFIFFCIAFSLDALARPGPSARVMGAVARQRARPWLIGASIALLAVSLLIVAILVWLVVTGNRHGREVVVDWYAISIGWLDLSVTGLVTIAIVLTGQAIVSYEIFTGRTLPTRGLRRQWHNVMILAAGYGLAVAFSFTLESPATEMALLATLVVAVIFALVSRQSYVERERYITHLRPFVASEHVYDALVASQAASPEVGASASFAALCRDVLDAKLAYLVPIGSLSSLVPAPLVYGTRGNVAFPLDEVIAQCSSPQVMNVAIDPERYGGAIWAVPLRGARGMVGVLLLGEKTDGGLYAQEEIEIARASGERLLDSMAAATLAQRLMALQRRRFIESQVLDQQSRRALHDEVLPSLHAAMLSLRDQCAGAEGAREALEQLAEVHGRVSALLREMPSGLASQVGKLGLIGALRQAVETEFAHEFDGVQWEMAPEAEGRGRTLPALTADVVFYAAKEVVRNAARHGRGGDVKRALHMRIGAAWRDGLEIRIADDGVGMVALTEGAVSSGQGLALHGTMLAVIGGSLVTESRPGGGTSVMLFVPAERWEQA